MPDSEKLELKGFKILNFSKAIAAGYLIWIYLYFKFYQKYWTGIKKDISKLKEQIFKQNIAFNILVETHERHDHNFDWFYIHSLHLSPIMEFWISYSPVSFSEEGERDHGRRHWVIDLKKKGNRKYIFSYLVNVYCRSPLVTFYFIPILFPILAGFICFLSNWPGNLMTIITNW
ncbi:MAG: hypothetical protein K9M96_13335 [Deltaproteobacteria bacterium]|nr:hypothetical protein [Deltaproteobacteria bacterium]